MTKIKRGTVTKKRHKRVLKAAKGFWGSRKNLFKRAKETLLRAMAFAFKSRKLKKRDMRGLFITRISAGAKAHGLKYNTFMHGLKKSHIQLNRKVLSQVALFDPSTFARLTELAKK